MKATLAIVAVLPGALFGACPDETDAESEGWRDPETLPVEQVNLLLLTTGRWSRWIAIGHKTMSGEIDIGDDYDYYKKPVLIAWQPRPEVPAPGSLPWEMPKGVDMKEKPIILKDPEVLEILANGAAQIHRRVRPGTIYASADHIMFTKPPPYTTGDHLWVREAWYLDLCPYANPGWRGSLSQKPNDPHVNESLYYRADGECCDQIPECQCADVGKTRWRPASTMPRWAARLFLDVTKVRAERDGDTVVWVYDVERRVPE